MALYKAARPRRTLDSAESEREQVSGDVLSRTAGAGRTPRRSVRSLHRAGVPEAGHAEDPGPLSGLATLRRQGALAVVFDLSARRLVLWPIGRRGSVVEPPVPPAHRLDGPGCVGQEGGQAKIASGWPPGFGALPGRSLTPGGSVNAHCRASALYRSALLRTSDRRRRSVPPSPSVSVSQSVNQRWRERPRCPALRVTPGRRDGVVHAIVGRAACRCLRAHVVQDERAARAHVFVSRFAGTNAACKRNRNQFVRVALCSRQKRHVCGSRFRHRTIAPFMLAPCSASSMLFASLRPGRRPGLRALTTPPRGTSWAIARWSATDDSIG